MKCRIGGFNVEFHYNYPRLYEFCSDYAAEFETPDFSVGADLQAVRQELARAPIESDEVNFEFMLSYRLFADGLPTRGAFVLHSAAFEVDGAGVALAAQSGTGKTTHMLRWKQLLGDRLTVINGDKPIIRFHGETPYIYGTPWNGKEDFGCNMRSPLKHLCFIVRDSTNFAVELDANAAVSKIFNQVYMPSDPKQAAATISLIDRLLGSCRLWEIHCNTDENAAEAPFKVIFGGRV